jgi:hypothetical protein
MMLRRAIANIIRIDEKGATVAPALKFGIRSEFYPARVHQPYRVPSSTTHVLLQTIHLHLITYQHLVGQCDDQLVWYLQQ